MPHGNGIDWYGKEESKKLNNVSISTDNNQENSTQKPNENNIVKNNQLPVISSNNHYPGPAPPKGMNIFSNKELSPNENLFASNTNGTKNVNASNSKTIIEESNKGNIRLLIKLDFKYNAPKQMK